MEKEDPSENVTLALLRLVRFLREHERGDAIEQRAKMARELLAGMQDEAKRGRRDHYTAMSMIEMTTGQLNADVARARDAEEYIKRLGWRMDAAGKVTRIRKGRGADLLAECAWAIYTEKHQGKGNTAPVRRKISRELSPYFEESELSEDARAPIYRAIYNRERHRR